jgi:hypothetical protein
MDCGHKCHTVGLNPWVEECLICGCPNKDYDDKVSAPRTLEELLNWDAPKEQE